MESDNPATSFHIYLNLSQTKRNLK